MIPPHPTTIEARLKKLEADVRHLKSMALLTTIIILIIVFPHHC